MRQPTLLIAAFLILAVARPVPSPAAAATLAGAAVAPTGAAVAIRPQAGARLPTGALLDPAGRSSDLGNMPIAMALAPEGDRVVVLLAGWREQGFQVVETSSGRVLQTVELPAAFLGLAFSADGHTLYVAGGYEDVIYRFDWQAGAATPAGAIALADRPEAKKGSRYPAGLALSRDGRTLYVAENLADSLAVVDLASGKVLQRLPAGHYPYAAVVGGGGEVYVSAWGGDTVSVFAPAAGAGTSSAGAAASGGSAVSGGAAAAPASGTSGAAPGAAGPSLAAAGSIQVGRHPSALLLSASGARLFVASASTDRVAVVDTRARRVVAQLADAAPAGPAEGSTPSALALTAGGRRLLVAESDNNAVAVFDLAAATSGVAAAPPRRGRAGRDRRRRDAGTPAATGSPAASRSAGTPPRCWLPAPRCWSSTARDAAPAPTPPGLTSGRRSATPAATRWARPAAR